MAGQYAPGDPSRPFTPHAPPAVDFIVNRGPQYHQAFDTRNVQYNPSLGQFVPRSPPPSMQVSSSLMVPDVSAPSPRATPGSVNDMDFWAEVFPKAMERLNAEPEPGGGYEPRWSIRQLSVWRDVQARLDIAQREYDFYHGPKTVGKFRRKLRDIMDKWTVPLQQSMKMVPNVDMASPVVGAVNILLDAYRQAAEVREKVDTAFDNLPASFATMDFYLRIYSEDQNIITASIELVFVTFKAIECAVAFYTSHQVRRAGRAIFAGTQYQETLSKSLTEVQSCCDALESQADLSFKHRMISDNDQVRRSNARIMQDNMANGQALGTMLQEERWTQNLLNMVLFFLVERERNWPVPRSPIPSRCPTPQPGDQPSYWAPQALWAWLRIPNLDEDDMRHVLRNAAQIFFEDRGRAEQVIETRHFSNWILNPGSAKLLVHGDFDDTTQQMSPLSILCATLTQAFRTSRGTISLVFFCGQHLAWDEHRGGAVMIRSLLAQLLRQFPYFNILPDPEISPQAVETGDVKNMCKLFVVLMRQIPRNTTVFCLIDGINLYQANEYLRGMRRVVECLLELVETPPVEVTAKFKLLLMSPRPTVEVRQIFEEEPETLLHMATFPEMEPGMGLARLQRQFGAGTDSPGLGI